MEVQMTFCTCAHCADGVPTLAALKLAGYGIEQEGTIRRISKDLPQLCLRSKTVTSAAQVITMHAACGHIHVLAMRAILFPILGCKDTMGTSSGAVSRIRASNLQQTLYCTCKHNSCILCFCHQASM